MKQKEDKSQYQRTYRGFAERNRRHTGQVYEEKTASILSRRGYEILERNFCVRGGEIDLIAKDGDTLVFIEVEYRSSLAAGDPAEAVDQRKQERIRKAAAVYLGSRGISDSQICRFDVAAWLGEDMRLLQNAF